MRSFAFATLLSLAPLLALAKPQLSPLVLHERRHAVPDGWVPVGKPSTRIPLRLGLTQPNADMESLDVLLADVAHPKSPNFGEHWSAEKVAAHFAPSKEAIQTVKDWLESELGAGRSGRVTNSKGWIEVDVSVNEAEKLLGTEYFVYGHSETGRKHIACESYHLPQHVKPHVDLVTPTVHFDVRPQDPKHIDKRADGTEPARKIGQPNQGPVSPKTTGTVKSIFNQLENCDKQTTLVCLRALYGLVYEPLATSKNSYGIVEYTPQAYVASDLDLFFKNFSSSHVGKRPELVSIDGGVVQTNETGFDYNGESNLDLQYGMALVGNQEVTLYQTGDEVEGASFNDFLDALDGAYCTYEGGDDPSQDATYPDPSGGYQGKKDCGTTKPTNVISTSYGYDEADLTPFYTARQCAEYAKLGLMGVTVVYSSGDYGVAGNGGLCLNANGSQSASGKIFNPAFPSTCPYITSVGATQVNPGSSVFEPEGACEQVIYSGGGFSNYFATPSYQKKHVQSFLANHKPSYTAAQYNATGTSRAYPDLSANGANYVVAVDGNFSLVYGTSASAPVVGALLTMVNDARIAVGKKPIGFINPTIYSDSFASAFNDITTGGNQGCGTKGFTAVEGWDPVTGLGTPSFPKLLAKWLLLK